MFRVPSTRLSYKSAIAFNSPSPMPDIPPAFYWLDAEDAVNGATTWTSKEGKVFTNSGIVKTANALNGLPVVSAVSSWSTGTAVYMEAGCTVFAVLKSASSHGNEERIITQSAGGADYITSGGTGPISTSGSGFGTLRISVGLVGVVAGSYSAGNLVVHRRNGTAVTNLNYRAGVAEASATGTSNSVTAGFTLFGVGGLWSDYGGQIAEVIYFSQTLSDTQFALVRDMLRTKYALV